MKKDNDEDRFLGKWLSGDLSDKELKSFKKSKDYLAYKDILKGVERLEGPIFDIEKKLKEQKKYNATFKQNKKARAVKPFIWVYSAAAIIIALVGLRVLFFQDVTTVHTIKGQMSVITLPDYSVVTLNADSSLEYDKKSFLKQKILKLEGEAFFDVKKGASFTVNTQNGKISVLGTEFNVYSRNQTLEVHCFEGKVSVRKGGNEVILTPGKGVKYTPKEGFSTFEVSNLKPDWLNGKSSFSEVPLNRIIQELERQYNIKINAETIDVKRVFTGFFIHNNLKIALKTSFDPMNISYTFNKEGVIVLENK